MNAPFVRNAISLILASILIFSASGCLRPPGNLDSNNSNQQVNKVQQSVSPSRRIAIDLHADTAQRMVDLGIDINTRQTAGSIDAIRMKQGGLDAEFFSVWVEPSIYGSGGKGAIDRADSQIKAIRTLVQNHPEIWKFALTAEDIEAAVRDGKLSVLIGLEGGYALDDKIENVKRYYDSGIRYMSPTWSVSTSWAGSSGDSAGDNRGLNDFGKLVIREMNRLGMIIDVSHVSDKTFWDIVATSDRPIIASHSNCRGIANVKRNLSDDMIRAIAKSGGVVGVVFYPEFVESGWQAKREQVDAEIADLVKKANDSEKGSAALKKIARDNVRIEEYRKRLPAVPLTHLVDHIDHIVKVAGIDYVSIGSDYDGVQATVQGLEDVSQLNNLVNELTRRGYSSGDIDKIMGGNVLRVLRAVEHR